MGGFVEGVGPVGPFGVFAWVRGDEQAGDEEWEGDDLAGPGAFFNKLFEGWFVGEIAEEHAVDGLHLERFCLVSTRTHQFNQEVNKPVFSAGS